MDTDGFPQQLRLSVADVDKLWLNRLERVALLDYSYVLTTNWLFLRDSSLFQILLESIHCSHLDHFSRLQFLIHSTN